MPNRTIAVHTTETNIATLDEMAEKLRRSRNSFINEGIEMVIESYHAAVLEAAKKSATNKKKAGKK